MFLSGDQKLSDGKLYWEMLIPHIRRAMWKHIYFINMFCE